MMNIKVTKDLFEKPKVDLGTFLDYIKSRDIIHYSITSIGSYVFPEFPTNPRKYDSIKLYYSEYNKFHLNGSTLVYNGKEWCLLCKSCHTNEEARDHDIQINRNKKLLSLI